MKAIVQKMSQMGESLVGGPSGFLLRVKNENGKVESFFSAGRLVLNGSVHVGDEVELKPHGDGYRILSVNPGRLSEVEQSLVLESCAVIEYEKWRKGEASMFDGWIPAKLEARVAESRERIAQLKSELEALRLEIGVE